MASEQNEVELGLGNSSSKNQGGNPSWTNDENLNLDDDGLPRRRGTAMTASAHIFTGVIGAGVLSLAWSVGQLGWIAGPLMLLIFACVTYYTANLLADCYRSPDPITGRRNHNYVEAVRANLGEKEVFWCGVVQYVNLVGTAIGYTITSAVSMVAVQRSDCFHNKGHSARCHASNNPYMVAFGVCQLIFSQIPDFNRIWWLSIVAALMSFFYSAVGFGLGVSKAIEGGYSHGTLGGDPIGTENGDLGTAEKTWHILQAIGNISFAYSFSMILLEIQDTLRGPPEHQPENKTMKQAIVYGISVPTFFYTGVATAGYLAFGNDVPRNILTGFGFYNPFWLVDLANISIVVHLVGAYQVYVQPVFAFVENKALLKWPNSSFIHREVSLKVRFNGPLTFNWFRILWRSSFVILTTTISMLFPFFNDVTGLIGAISFWPLTVYFPVEMYIKHRRIEAWTRKWTSLKTLSFISLLVSVAAATGSAEGIIDDLKDYKPFRTKY